MSKELNSSKQNDNQQSSAISKYKIVDFNNFSGYYGTSPILVKYYGKVIAKKCSWAEAYNKILVAINKSNPEHFDKFLANYNGEFTRFENDCQQYILSHPENSNGITKKYLIKIKMLLKYFKISNDKKYIRYNKTEERKPTIDNSKKSLPSLSNLPSEYLHDLDCFNNIQSSVLLFYAKQKNAIVKYVIVTDKKQEDFKQNILHYSNLLARCLFAAHYQHADKKCKYNNEEITVVQCLDKNGLNRYAPESIALGELVLQTGGGYYSKIKNNLTEIVDLLLYSPFSKFYEIIHVTYDKKHKYYYVDPGLFRKHIREHGNPGIRLNTCSPGGYGYEWNELRAESMLKTYGYTVNMKDNLSANERENILSELVDLKIFEISYIVKMLEFFIDSHPSDRYYYARRKWEEDINYIKNYKANPDRFLILS